MYDRAVGGHEPPLAEQRRKMDHRPLPPFVKKRRLHRFDHEAHKGDARVLLDGCDHIGVPSQSQCVRNRHSNDILEGLPTAWRPSYLDSHEGGEGALVRVANWIATHEMAKQRRHLRFNGTEPAFYGFRIIKIIYAVEAALDGCIAGRCHDRVAP